MFEDREQSAGRPASASTENKGQAAPPQNKQDKLSALIPLPLVNDNTTITMTQSSEEKREDEAFKATLVYQTKRDLKEGYNK